MSDAMDLLPKRSKARITKDGQIYDQRINALRRLQARQFPPTHHRPTDPEIEEARSRWQALRHKIH